MTMSGRREQWEESTLAFGTTRMSHILTLRVPTIRKGSKGRVSPFTAPLSRSSSKTGWTGNYNMAPLISSSNFRSSPVPMDTTLAFISPILTTCIWRYSHPDDPTRSSLCAIPRFQRIVMNAILSVVRDVFCARCLFFAVHFVDTFGRSLLT